MDESRDTLINRAEEVLQDHWHEREPSRKFDVLGVDLIVAALFVAAAVALAWAVPAARPLPVVEAAGLLLAYALGGRILIAVGAGFAVPTQLALVPMLVVLPPATVPLVVAACLVVAGLADDARARRPPNWRAMVAAVGDASYALAPALVFAGLGAPQQGVTLLIACLTAAAAQCAADFAISAARVRAVSGIAPKSQFAVMSHVWAIDLMLWPVGLILAQNILRSPWSVAAIFPLLVLLQVLVHERERRLKEAQDRLTDLDAERDRLDQAVRRVGEAFATGHDLEAMLRTTLRTAADAIGATDGRVVLTRTSRGSQVVTLGLRYPIPAPNRRGQGGPPPTIASDVHVSATDGEQVEARVELTTGRGAPTEAQCSLVRFLAEQAVAAESQIERTRLVHEAAQTDALTGLANFRRLHDVLDQEIKNHERNGQPLTLVLLDLDHFKSVNDQFGHQAGDLVLQAVADRLRTNRRLSDLAARHGGEELALVLPDTDVEGGLAVARRTAESIRDAAVELSATESVSVTASIGVATLGVHAADKAMLISAADAALYEAKRAGRDRVRCAEPSVLDPV